MRRLRYSQITFFFARVLFNLALWELLLPRLGLRSWVSRTRAARLRKYGRQFRLLAISLSGVMIKVGQFLSARVDVLPVEITTELAGLQDEVPPESFEDIRQVAEAELGKPLEARFAYFDPQPLAAASLGQVHRASLWSEAPAEATLVDATPGDSTQTQDLAQEGAGETRRLEVVVKVQRPGIRNLIQIDLAALRTVGGWLQRYPPIRQRADVPALLEEFRKILYEEVDYLLEGAHAETFAANFQDNPWVRAPRVLWSHTTRQVLTLEDVWGIKITDYPALEQAGIDRAEVATRLLDLYLQQIFKHGFFHADPHPGNLFINPTATPETGAPWQLAFVDFGMVGRISPETRQGLRELVIALGTQDAARLVRSYQMLGVLLPGVDYSLLEKAELRLFERFWGKSMSELKEISVDELREIAVEFRQLIYQMPFQAPHDLIFFARTVGILSGICTGLNPQFNLWQVLAPYAQDLLLDEAAAPSFWLDELGRLVQKWMDLPRRAQALLAQVERGELIVHDPQLTGQIRRLEAAILRLSGMVVFAALLLAAVQFYLSGQLPFAGAFGLAAIFVLAWALWARRSPPE